MGVTIVTSALQGDFARDIALSTLHRDSQRPNCPLQSFRSLKMWELLCLLLPPPLLLFYPFLAALLVLASSKAEALRLDSGLVRAPRLKGTSSNFRSSHLLAKIKTVTPATKGALMGPTVRRELHLAHDLRAERPLVFSVLPKSPRHWLILRPGSVSLPLK